MPLLGGERLALLAKATDKYALQHVRFDRDASDSNRIQIETIRPGAHQLTRAEVMPALPVGSGWTGAIGWESYVVFPPGELRTEDLAIVGLEYVLSHPSRGGYPIFGGAVLRAKDVANVLLEIANGLSAERANAKPCYGVVRSDEELPERYRRDAADLLRRGSSSFAVGRYLLVRTVVLTEDEVPRKKSFIDFVWSERVLLGTVEPLRRAFSRKVERRLRGAEF